ncbi:MAG: hypothetical protein R3F61_22715 [Myxococcota bacterium]
MARPRTSTPVNGTADRTEAPRRLPIELERALAGRELERLLLDLQGPGLMLGLDEEPTEPDLPKLEPDIDTEDAPLTDRPHAPPPPRPLRLPDQQLLDLRRQLGVQDTVPPTTRRDPPAVVSFTGSAPVPEPPSGPPSLDSLAPTQPVVERVVGPSTPPTSPASRWPAGLAATLAVLALVGLVTAVWALAL